MYRFLIFALFLTFICVGIEYFCWNTLFQFATIEIIYDNLSTEMIPLYVLKVQTCCILLQNAANMMYGEKHTSVRFI